MYQISPLSQPHIIKINAIFLTFEFGENLDHFNFGKKHSQNILRIDSTMVIALEEPVVYPVWDRVNIKRK